MTFLYTTAAPPPDYGKKWAGGGAPAAAAEKNYLNIPFFWGYIFDPLCPLGWFRDRARTIPNRVQGMFLQVPDLKNDQRACGPSFCMLQGQSWL